MKLFFSLFSDPVGSFSSPEEGRNRDKSVVYDSCLSTVRAYESLSSGNATKQNRISNFQNWFFCCNLKLLWTIVNAEIHFFAFQQVVRRTQQLIKMAEMWNVKCQQFWAHKADYQAHDVHRPIEGKDAGSLKSLYKDLSLWLFSNRKYWQTENIFCSFFPDNCFIN